MFKNKQCLDSRRKTIGIMAGAALLLAACNNEGANNQQASEPAAAPPAPAAEAAPADNAASDHIAALAANLEFCNIPDAQNPSSAFNIAEGEKNEVGDYYVRYTCKETCADWQQCQASSYSSQGEAIMHGRNAELPKQALAFVVDGLGGHMSFSTDQTGDQTLVFHTGGGGTNYNAGLAEKLEQESTAGTVMVRWDDGFIMPPNGPMPFKVGWGWYSRTSQEAARVPDLNIRVASAISWVHENLAGPAEMGTLGCSMGAQATFGAVFWHGLDDIVDYQALGGGPPLWDINAGCGLRTYTEGYCDLDANVTCSTDADCASLSEESHCRVPEVIPFDFLYEGVVNHVHATQNCKIKQATAESESYAPFDESSIAFTKDGDWEIDHPVDFVVDVWNPVDMQGGDGGGDEYWSLGHFMRVYQGVNPQSGHEKQWHAFQNASHCESFDNGNVANIVVSRMGLQ